MSNNIVIFWVHNVPEKDILIFITRNECFGPFVGITYKYLQPYLDTTTSKQVEYTKAFELTIIKELGKMTP